MTAQIRARILRINVILKKKNILKPAININKNELTFKERKTNIHSKQLIRKTIKIISSSYANSVEDATNYQSVKFVILFQFRSESVSVILDVTPDTYRGN